MADSSSLCPPVRVCLLSGGRSRRMGSDKALLGHPRGGSWLEAALVLLAGLGAPITLLSGHRQHMQAVKRLTAELPVPLTPILEPHPHEGPLRALERLMALHPGESLLLCPVDMPWLELSCLKRLLSVAQACPDTIHVSHDGRRSQPLLGMYPAGPSHHDNLRAYLLDGGRAVRDWLEQVGYVHVPLPAAALRNANRPEDLVASETAAPSGCEPG